MGKKMTPSQIAEKQVRRAQSAVQDYKDGVMAVTTSPTQVAAGRVQAWYDGVTKAMNDGSFVDGCNSVSLQDWQNRTVQKGALTYASGVQQAQSTIQDFHTQLQAAQSNIDAQLSNMPRGDLSQNLQRMITQVTSMSQNFKFKKRRK